MTSLALSPVERAGLAAYLNRVVGLDDRAAVRVQARGPVAGIWSGPPLGVLALRPVALLEPADADLTVSARRLLDALDAGDPSSGRLDLPASVLGPAWAAVLPPQSGWELVAEVPVAVLVDQVGVMVEGYQRRVALVAAGDRSQARLEQVADELWAGPSLGPVTMRSTHAASRLGLLGREGQAGAWRSGGWGRLACPGGSVLARTDELGPGERLAGLDVLGLFGAG